MVIKKLAQSELDEALDKITVNSSPFAIKIYHHLGFINTNTEQLTDGMRYTPMIYTKC